MEFGESEPSAGLPGMTIEIPLKESDEVIEIDIANLAKTESSALEEILTAENAPVNTWYRVAIEYYRLGMESDYLRIMESARKSANQTNQKDVLILLNSLGAFYLKQASKEKSKEAQRKLIADATLVYTTGDKISMSDTCHLVGRAYLCLLEGGKTNQAEAQFNYVLNDTVAPSCVPAMIGKACIEYNKMNYRVALMYYKKALTTNPNWQAADVRAGIGHCLWKLGMKDQAARAYKRALEIDTNCVGALVGLAIHQLNIRSQETIKFGITLLSKAYSLERTNPMVLNHLADHFFFKKDFLKVNQLATHAIQNTEIEAIRAESSYMLAKSFHIQGDYEKAFQFYYQATQYGAPSFVLPQFGLGQMYINTGDYENAALWFEKVLKAQPDNYETLKILGSLYTQTTDQAKHEVAKEYFRKVTAMQPDDVEAWIELTLLLDEQDPRESLRCCNKVVELFREKVNAPMPLEIVNNIGSLYYRLGQYHEARKYFQDALDRAEEPVEDTSQPNCIPVTTAYNLGRVHEALCNFGEAEKLYKNILKEHPNYIDCYLRLGCMARDKGQIYDASDWFKEALQVDQENPDTWSLIGNLHIMMKEWGPGQKKFERILTTDPKDTYAMVALGNVWLQALHTPSGDKEKMKKKEERALKMYSTVLQMEPKNIWAANGIGCVLAHKGCMHEARDVFAQVREATADFCDVWLNLAHVYTAQKQYVNAIQMYENCMKKFYKGHNIEILQFLARAYYKCGMLKKAKLSLLKARRICPADKLVLFNLALVLQMLGTQTLRDEKSTLLHVLNAVRYLDLARKYFQNLHEDSSVDRPKVELRMAAAAEAQQCRDLQSQSQYYVARARQQDEDEKRLRRKHEEQREAFHLRQLEEKRKLEERQRLQIEEAMRKREEFKEKMRNALIFTQPEPQEKGGNKKRGNKPEDDGFICDGSGDEIVTREEKKAKQKESRKNRKKKEARKRREEKSKRKKNDDASKSRSKHRKKILSKANLSTDSDESESEKMDASGAVDDEGRESPAMDSEDKQ